MTECRKLSSSEQADIADDEFYKTLISEENSQIEKKIEEDKFKRKISRTLKSAGEDELPPYIYEAFDRTGQPVLKVSRPLLADTFRKNEHYFWIESSGTGTRVKRYFYEKGVYSPVSDDLFKGKIKGYVSKYGASLVKMSDIEEVFKNLITDNKFLPACELDNDENIINFQNGILKLDTMELVSHSPKYRSSIQIPCEWNEAAAESPVFDKFINEFTSENEQIKELILQFMGVCISNVKGFRMKQALFLFGGGNTGKTQLKALTERILGPGNYSSIDLKDLENRFGSSQLVGKRLCGSADMSFASIKELKIFKNVTGGDNVYAEEKGINGFSFVYNGLLWFCMNRLPRFGGDNGRWVYERIIPIECTHTVPPEKQDKQLCDKMFEERESIIKKCVFSLKKVISNGYRFDVPDSVVSARSRYRESNDIYIQFFNECCVMRDNHSAFNGDNATTGNIYTVFKQWFSKNYGYSCPSSRDFKQGIYEALKNKNGALKNENIEFRTNKGRYYIFTLNVEAKNEYYGGSVPYDSIA